MIANRIEPANAAPPADAAGAGRARLRILMVVPNPCTNDSRVIKEAQSLAAVGHEVRVLCRARAGLPARQLADGVTYVRVPMDPWLWLVPGGGRRGTAPAAAETDAEEPPGVTLAKIRRFAASRLRRLAAAAARAVGVVRIVPLRSLWAEAEAFRPDVIHVHDLAPLPAGVRAARMLNADVVYDSHELESHRNGLGGIGRVQVSLIEGWNIRKVAAVITVCDSIAEFLAGKYRIARPAVVLNAPEVSGAADAKEGVREFLGLPREAPLAIYVGKVTFGRGLEQLIDAMPHCPEFHVALLGPRVDWFEDGLRNRAERRAVSDRLHFVPSVPPDAVVAFIGSADIGVVPIQDVCLSYRYCMPNKLFEMAFAGVPACVSDLPEMRTFVERERTGLVMDQTDPADIADKMRELYRRRAEFRVTGAGRQRLIDLYSWRRQAERLTQVYQQLCGPRAAAPSAAA